MPGADGALTAASLLPRIYRRLANGLIAPLQPREPELQVVIADLDARPLRCNRKVDPLAFFPPFCKALAGFGIGSRFARDAEGVEKAIARHRGKMILINLVDEDRDDLGKYDLPDGLLGEFSAIFNSHGLAGMLRDKRRTSDHLASCGVNMPRPAAAGGKAFILPRTGSGHGAIVADGPGWPDDASHSTEFIDTRGRFKGRLYYTSLQLM